MMILEINYLAWAWHAVEILPLGQLALGNVPQPFSLIQGR
jgi:hypothetical protein